MRDLLDALHVDVGATEALAQHTLRSAILLATFLLVAWLAGLIAGRWARSLGKNGRALDEAHARSLARSLSLFIALIGAYVAVAALGVGDRPLQVVGACIYVLAALVAMRFLTRLATGLLRSYFAHRADGPSRDRAEREYLPLTNSVATIGVFLLVVITVAHHFGHDVTSLVTALGVGSLAIGLAAQQTLGNMFAGFTLLVDRPFRPGDRVKLASGEIGEVLDIGIRATRLQLADENLLIVPNTEMANSRIVNFAFPTSRMRGEVRVKVPLGDVASVSEVLLDGARAQPEVLADPAPLVTLDELDGNDGELVLHFRVAEARDQALVEDRIRRHYARVRATQP